MSATRQHQTYISSRNGEVRYGQHVVAVLTTFMRDRVDRPRNIGTTVARLTFTPSSVSQVNKFWLGIARPTHVALPTKDGKGPRRVYELIEIDLAKGKGIFRTPHVAIEEPRR